MRIPEQPKWIWNGRQRTIELFLPARNTQRDTYINAVIEGTKWSVWVNDQLVASGDDVDAQRQAERVICTGQGKQPENAENAV